MKVQLCAEKFKLTLRLDKEEHLNKGIHQRIQPLVLLEIPGNGGSSNISSGIFCFR